MYKNEHKETIVICDKCQGSGKVEDRRTLYDSDTIKCLKCDGLGRLLEIRDIKYVKYNCEVTL